MRMDKKKALAHLKSKGPSKAANAADDGYDPMFEIPADSASAGKGDVANMSAGGAPDSGADGDMVDAAANGNAAEGTPEEEAAESPSEEAAEGSDHAASMTDDELLAECKRRGIKHSDDSSAY